MSKSRMWGLMLRHLYPLKRDFDLLSDMLYWPIVDIVLWGITSQWLSETAGVGYVVAAILVALVLWNVLWRAQSEISRNLMDEIWNNNLVNLFSTPLKVWEWVVGVLLLSVVKTAFTIAILIPIIFGLYSVNVLAVGGWMLAFFLSVIVTGWSVGFVSAGIVLRWGPKVQTVIWTLPAVLLPFSAIYFPLDKLPAAIQPISRVLPTTYVFESMRAVLSGGVVAGEYMVLSFMLNTVFLAASLVFFVRSFYYSLDKGLGRFN